MFTHIVITATEIELKQFQAVLKNKFESINRSVYELELTTSGLILGQQKKDDLLFVSGLQYLPVQHRNTYAIRTYLDKGIYTNIRSFIFCETASYEKYFKDYTRRSIDFVFSTRLRCSVMILALDIERTLISSAVTALFAHI